jgi:hypothetical protein
VSKRIAIAAAFFLLLLQAGPALACVSMPTQGPSACCCEPDHNFVLAESPSDCAVAGACPAQTTGSTLALSASTAHPDDRPLPLSTPGGAPPASDPLCLIERRASLDAAQLHHSLAPRSSVPLYLRHLRLTL